jgi:tripartite ATP-independent transporter DctP family solute receptor
MLATFFTRVAPRFLARRLLPLLGAGLLAAAAAAAPPVRQVDIADYRAYLAEDHPVRQGMREFARLAAAASGGSLQVHPRGDALPGTPAEQIAALRAGVPGAPALMLVAGTGLAGVDKDFELLDLPFLVRDPAEADALLGGPFGNALLARLAPAGLVGLGWWENGFRQLTTSGTPIRRAADLRALKLRVIGAPVFIDTARALGADPVPLPFGELYPALKARRVDAEDNFTSQILAGRLYEVQSSLSLTNHSYSPLVLVANAAFWNSLDPAEQRVLREAAAGAGAFQRRAARAEAHAARTGLAAKGLAVYALAPAELETLHALTAPLRRRYFSQHDPRLWQLYQAQVAEP